ncbi:MAG: hypothetical protein ACJ763_14770 [Bdellovibrionia bacterium]
MTKKIPALSLAFLLSQTCYAHPCYPDAGDATVDPKKVLYAVEFQGPSNPFWSYVSESPESWSFRIVQNDKKSKAVPEFETFSVKVPDNKQIDLKSDLKFKSGIEFQIRPARVKEIVNAYRSFFELYRKKSPAQLPSASQQILQFYITFKSPSGNADENWLNHHCSVGFGSNRMFIRLMDSFSAKKQRLELDVNQPDLNSAEYGSPLPSRFSLEAKSGAVEIKGLPIGTFIARLDTESNEQIPIAQMWGLFKTCKMAVKRESEKLWSVRENDCNRP